MMQETEGGAELSVASELFSPTAVRVVLAEPVVGMPSALTVPASKLIWLMYLGFLAVTCVPRSVMEPRYLRGSAMLMADQAGK